MSDTLRLRHVALVTDRFPGLGFVGLEGQRTAASATLRGVGPDADHVVGTLVERVRVGVTPRRCCLAVPA